MAFFMRLVFKILSHIAEVDTSYLYDFLYLLHKLDLMFMPCDKDMPDSICTDVSTRLYLTKIITVFMNRNGNGFGNFECQKYATIYLKRLNQCRYHKNKTKINKQSKLHTCTFKFYKILLLTWPNYE